MAEADRSARLIQIGERIDSQWGPDVVRGVQVVAQLASGQVAVFDLPATYTVLPPEPIPEFEAVEAEAIDTYEPPPPPEDPLATTTPG